MYVYAGKLLRAPTKSMQVEAHSAEYQPFSDEGAARVAEAFGIFERRDELFSIVSEMTQRYERYKLRPDGHQMKQALSKLSAAIGDAASITQRYSRELQSPLEGSLLRLLGELLTYESLERLTGKRLVRTQPIATRFKPADPDEHSRMERSVLAAQAGPRLLVALFEQMKLAIDDTIEQGRRNAGGRPTKHLYRHMIMYELALNHAYFFGKPPTTTATGHYARFCKAVLDELECDTTGFEKAVPRVLNNMGIFPRRRLPATPKRSSP